MPYVEIGYKQTSVWPPEDKDTEQRLLNYKKCRQLFKGQHYEVYERVQRWLEKESDEGMTYVICNFPGLISKVSADMLFGEKLKFIAGEPGSREQDLVNQLVDLNDLHSLNYEMGISGSWRGETIYKMRYGARPGWEKADQGAIIEAVSPSYFFPILDGDNVRGLKGAVFGWLKEPHNKVEGNQKRKYLRIERQLPGKIENELWMMQEDGRNISQQVKLSTFPEYAELEDQQETGFPGLLFKVVPNWRLEDEFWGISDYYDMESLFDELNNRLSRISRVLDKHESPKLILPPGIMKWDERTQRWYVEKEDLDAIELDQSDESAGNLPRYVTWDAQLEAAFQQAELLMKSAFLVSETSPDAFGMGEKGAAESGRALKFRLIRLLAKVNRKKMYFDEALKYVLDAALHLEYQHGKSGVDPEGVDIRTEWADGLPDDPLEMAMIEHTRTGNKATSSRRSAVRRLDGLEGDDLEDELAMIDTDEAGMVPDAGPVSPDRRLPLFGDVAPAAEGDEAGGE